MRSRLLLCAGVCALLLGCSNDDSEPAEDHTFDAFDAEVDALLAELDLDGATAAIVHEDDGVMHVKGYGSFTAEHVSMIASSSKILSVGVLMRLADDGLLDLDAPISDHLGDWGEHKTDITVAQMLSNSSGMPGLADAGSYQPYLCQVTGVHLDACGEELYTADDAMDRVAPDTEFIYGGAQWQLAGAIAEVVSGKTWEELLQEIYIEPCGLTTLGYTNQFLRVVAEYGVDNAFAYPAWVDGSADNIDPSDNPLIEGGGYTTAGDYGELLLMHLRGGVCGDNRVLSEGAVERMREDRIDAAYQGSTGSNTWSGYGMGWWIDRDTGLIQDGGAYGSTPWLDLGLGYGAMVIVEASTEEGSAVFERLEPVLREIFEARASQ